MEKYEYYAFISYKREDEKWAEWLQEKLEYYKLPTYIKEDRPDIPDFIRPIFRDATDLEIGLLNENIHRGLRESRYLIVVCSPNTPKSKWVNLEIEEFAQMGKAKNIIPFIVDGIANAEDESQECLPDAIKKLSFPGEDEILGANIHELSPDYAVVKVIARMLEIRIDKLWQRYLVAEEKEKQRLKEQNDRLLTFQSNMWAAMADTLIEDGNSQLAQKLAIEALPCNLNEPERPFTIPAEMALRRAVDAELTNDCISIIPHNGSIQAIAVSMCGKYIATKSNFKIYIWDISNSTLVNSYKCHDCLSMNLLFTNTGSVIYDDRNQIYKDGQKLYYSNTQINKILLKPDNGLLYIFNNNGDVSTIDTDGKIYANDFHICYNASLFTFSNDGKLLGLVNKEDAMSRIEIYNATTFEIIEKTTINAPYLLSLKFSYDGRFLAYSTDDGVVYVHEFNDIEQSYFINNACEYGPQEDKVRDILFSTDSKKIISASNDSTIRIYYTEKDGQYRTMYGHYSRIDSIVTTPDGKMLVSSSSDDKCIRIWNLKPLKVEKYDVYAVDSKGVAYSPNGKYLAYVSNGKYVRIINNITKEEIIVELFSKNDYHTILFSNNSDIIYCFDTSKGSCISYDIMKKEIEIFFDNNVDALNCNVELFNGYIAALSRENRKSIVLYNLAHGESKVLNLFENGYTNSISVNNDGTMCAVASTRANPVVIDILKGEKMLSLPIYEDWKICNYIKFNPAYNSIAYAVSDRLYTYDLNTQKSLVYSLDNDIQSIDFSSDGTKLAASDSHGNIICIDINNGENLEINVKDDCLVKFNPGNGNILAITTKNECKLKFWYLKENIVHEMKWQGDSYISDFQFRKDGKQMYILLNDRIRLFNFTCLQELICKTKEKFTNREFTEDEKQKFCIQ